MNKALLSLFLKFSRYVPKSLVAKFNKVQADLPKAGIKITFTAYVGLITFAMVIGGVLSFVFSFLLLFLVRSPILSVVVGAFLVAAIVCLMAVGLGYLFPMLMISSRSRKIDANLPLTANFMAVLASSGMPPERVFRSLANVGDEFGIGEEARRTIADIELLGMDLNGALKSSAHRSSSRKYASLLDGIVTTSHMGGDLAAYLRDESEKYKKARVSSMKTFLESLGGLAEVYVSFMIALPLALVVMLSIMSFMGGGANLIGDLDPEMVLTLLTYIVTPAGVGIMLLLVDSITPPR